MAAKKLKICPEGHSFYKSSDCPVCPVCEKERNPANGFLSGLSAPARRALQNKGINTVKELSGYSEKEILQLHGMGKASIPFLKKILTAENLGFKN